MTLTRTAPFLASNTILFIPIRTDDPWAKPTSTAPP